ncbi:NAD(P)-binding domain-containing protein [Nocardia sp. NPDC004604]|uniref:NAD(P)-binding domain-containing protein n=1 Tax=Nocardia sp. NPDC004604 TaxID=3157013 RepID=UPI0033A3206A
MRNQDAIARLAISAGLEVVLSKSRDPETPANLVADLGGGVRPAAPTEASRAADLVVAAIPRHPRYGRRSLSPPDQPNPGIHVGDANRRTHRNHGPPLCRRSQAPECRPTLEPALAVSAVVNSSSTYLPVAASLRVVRADAASVGGRSRETFS